MTQVGRRTRVDAGGPVDHPRHVQSEAPRRCVRAAPFLLAGLLSSSVPADTVQLAPAMPAFRPDENAPPEAVVEERSWRLCRVRTKVLLNMPDRSAVVLDDQRLLALGEFLDVSRDVPITWGSRAAIVRLRVRVRASVAKSPGVLYMVTTSAELVSAIGFESNEIGREQVRHAVLDVSESGTRVHEAWVSPEIQARLVVALAAEPVFGRAEPTALELLRPPPVDMHRFKVEALLKERETLTLLDQADLSALAGQDAVYSMGRFASEAATLHPVLRLGARLRLVEPRRVPESGFEKTHAVEQIPARRDYLIDHGWDPDSGFMAEHELLADTSDDPRSFTIRGKNNKISKKKREKLVAQQQVQAVREWAIERSKTLPSGEAVPDGFGRESLTLRITPLHATASTLQIVLRIEGHVRLPHEDALTAIATNVLEHLPRGEPFDIAVSELVRDAASDYDYVLRITPEP